MQFWEKVLYAWFELLSHFTGLDMRNSNLQVWFDLPKTSTPGMQADNKLVSQVDNGDLLATVKRREEDNFINYRLNL